MNRPFITQSTYLEASQLFSWATKDHYNIFINGSSDRSHRTEAILPRLAKKYSDRKTRGRSLFATKYGKRMIYICPRKIRNTEILYKVEHGLGCTESMVRFYRSNISSKVIEERKFIGCGCIPDFGIQYPNGQMLLVEFTTKDNFIFHNRIPSKVTNYKRHLFNLNERFKTEGIVVFIVDSPTEKILNFIKRNKLDFPAYYVSFDVFKTVPIGQQLSAPIYIYGRDGNNYPLIDNAQF